ncbi:schwannomin-interacting protein 1 homolog isoform X1 [Bombyx mori]|uniref:Schwannomin interacting protein 1 C-terminal domain-containing protein n=1 Tax=Bombyx mori TaxID=7091 RepID=A0A8R2HS78_BOMMO|nr:schwannomin-interacting protein 1 homolog isoform X1 [Bombyx mori]XP_021206793.2 schwannomin-interacting protein 1 homolog isoform X1 [Bombyx mori]
MKLRHANENGNVDIIETQDITLHRNTNDRNTRAISRKIYENIDNSEYNSNFNVVYDTRNRTETFLNFKTSSRTDNYESANVNVGAVVCNRQYRINTCKVIAYKTINSEAVNLEDTGKIHTAHPSFLESPNALSDVTPVDDERAFEQSDSDEMSENGIHPVPRGIVNPNYPGFQHLAHTLQDYSSNIENFYHSDNEMTDDDVDLEITEVESENNQKGVTCKNNNNNSLSTITFTKLTSSQNDITFETKTLDRQIKNEMPDLLKTVPKNINNNNEICCFELNCSDTDIENNFHTKEIIGDFNKEIEEEIRELLNYNINIQDDLEELRKDINDTLVKPIENTINNISEVVNHVIKKLVENQGTFIDQHEDLPLAEAICYTEERDVVDEISKINKENEKNARTEMNLNRPTFLYIENSLTASGKISDAFLSDGKDEINVSEYDTEKLSLNVENTIKQLSTELRKIIPKLDEMRERDKLWAENRRFTDSVVKDGNSNEIQSYSKRNILSSSSTVKDKSDIKKVGFSNSTIRNAPKMSQRGPRDRFREPKNSNSSAQSKISVHGDKVTKEIDLESFDVYNIETALPKLDLDAIESHLKAAKEAERRKRNDREEIRRRLAMGADADEYFSMGHTERPGKKPSLQSRLQSGMNLQICFMNETASENEFQDLDKNVNYETKSLSQSSLFSKLNYNHPYQTRPLSVNITKHDKISTLQSGAKLRPSALQKNNKSRSSHSLGHIELKESDFYALQATLQTEARIALAQAKEMARIQMEHERRSRPVSPVTEMLRRSMEKASAPLAADRRRVSRQLLTDMNIAQLQVIVNELHSQIESLNDSLVKLLMARDELHMGQDSMLVDIEDLTRYLGVKEQTKKTKGSKSGMKRLTSLVK